MLALELRWIARLIIWGVWLAGISHPLCWLVPSKAAFEGIMDLSAGSGTAAVKDIFILSAHCMAWPLLYAGPCIRGNTHNGCIAAFISCTGGL